MSMTFEEHKEATAADCEAAAELLTKLAAEVRSGDMRAFEAFWIEGGTEEGDAKVMFIREMMAMRFYHREEDVRSNVGGKGRCATLYRAASSDRRERP